jgi:hypothetical protein
MFLKDAAAISEAVRGKEILQLTIKSESRKNIFLDNAGS